MTQEEKQLLLQDICGRLPYGVKFTFTNGDVRVAKGVDLIVTDEGDWEYAVAAKGIEPIEIKYIKPYLRPMSSMTEEEKEHLQSLHNIISDENYEDGYSPAAWETISEFNDYCHEHHLDNIGLIGKGLALKAPEGMYKTKTE